jgi:hypothetical protein
VENFNQFDFARFPNPKMAVYVVTVRIGGVLRPIYVGKTETSLRARMGHYMASSIHTAADFVVGNAIALFQQKGIEVVICYKDSTNPSGDEMFYRKEFRNRGDKLLDFFPKYSGLGGCPAVTVKSLNADKGKECLANLEKFVAEIAADQIQ